ncbi:energy transducer TonB [Alkalilacustris brevis]|uniref:energy transducer TonB n=1 Tax=Alkalilacustris brevis TaxID=2026338 RepID=UPI000E0CECBA|nr:energy transducer TonB [Alkalilacustris brevis]
MRGVFQAVPFIALALAAHVALALGLQGQMGAQSSGAGGAALVSIEAAPARYAALAEEWQRPPQAITGPVTEAPASPAPADMAPAVQHDREPAPQSLDAPAALPSLLRAEAPLPAPGPLAAAAYDRPAAPANAPAAPSSPQSRPDPASPPVQTAPQQPRAAASGSDAAPDTTPRAPPVELAEARPGDARPRPRPAQQAAAASSAPRPQQAARGAGDGPAAGQRAEPAPAATLSQAQRNSYLASWGGGIRAQVERRKSYPDNLRRARIGGTATVALEVGRDGRLMTAGLAASSGHAGLDRAALDAVRGAGRFPSAPSALTAASYSFTLPISFQP